MKLFLLSILAVGGCNAIPPGTALTESTTDPKTGVTVTVTVTKPASTQAAH